LTGEPCLTYNERVIDTTENGDNGPDDVPRVWELRPRLHLWALLIPQPLILVPILSFDANPSVDDQAPPDPHVWQWINLTAKLWLFWVAAVHLLYFNAARRVQIARVRGKTEVTISTLLPVEPVISPDRFRRFRTGWPGQIFLEYRAGTRLWRVIRAIALLPGICISRKQFPDELRWKSFLEAIGDSGLWPESPMACSAYPPVYPESPCSRCGLAIPAYEARCPACATPRPVEVEIA
jgi:hypothetical protein